jgi:uncharacterized repeat protein (TIGR03803 family)
VLGYYRLRIFNTLGELERGIRTYALFALCTAAAITLPAQTLTQLHSFDNTDGANPYPAVLLANDGNFYGTTYGGGANSGNGTVFQMTPSGTLKDIYSFCAQTNCTDGALPIGRLIQADGNLYGTTAYGGANNRGTVFQITLGGTLTVLYSFCNLTGCADGSQPYAGLIQGKDGNFYGTTRFGGANSYGSVFAITSGGTLTTLYSFCPVTGCADGASPNAVLIQATNGNLYGTTLYGGANGDGAVFQITTGGTLTTLYSFCAQTNCTDGANPVAGLIQATDLNLYGTTEYGGANSNNGTVFKMTLGGALTTLYSFCSQAACADGQVPTGAVIQATDGNLYGTTDSGGIGYGTIFKITTSGTLTSLYSFPNEGVGAEPFAGLFQAPNGEFYGTTFIGGTNGYGEVYSLTVQVAVPNVVGLTQTAAATAITGVGLVVGTVTTASSPTVLSGDVISQSPVAPTLVNLGSAVDLVISTGPAVSLKPQTITFTAISSQIQGRPLKLHASASSGLPVTFTSSTPTICTVSGTTATLVSAGTCTIVASQMGNGVYAAATPVSRSFTVQAAFTITPLPKAETSGPGGIVYFSLEIGSTTGFTGSITVSCSGGPSGTSCEGFPTTIRLIGGGQVTDTIILRATILLPKNPPPGTYTMTFEGVSGAITNSATATLKVGG